MNRPFNKKRFWLIIAILALVEALVCYVVLQREYLFPSDEVSEVYTRYADDESIDASFIKGYRVNDTLFVDVTLLQAKDSAGWERLLNDFHLENVIDTSAYRQPHSFSISMVSPKDPTKRISSPDEPFCSLVAFPFEKEIHIYSTENDDHCMALHMYLLLNLSKQQTIKRK